MQAKKNVRFYVYISYFFTSLMVIFALAMGIVVYSRMSDLILAQTNRSYELIGEKIANKVHAIYEPVKNQTEILAQSHLSTGKTLNERLTAVDYLAKALEDIPSATSAYIGYADGQFFLLRQYARSAGAKEVFTPPLTTAWIVQSTSIERGTIQEYVVFLNNGLRELERRRIPLRPYDPRQRNWYRAAMDNPGHASVSAPYYFYTTNQMGITYSEKIAGEDAVLGIDIEMPTIHDTLKNSTVTPSTQMALIDGEGQLLAWQNGGKPAYLPSVITHKDGSKGLSLLTEQNTTVLHTLQGLPSGEYSSSQIVEADNRTWSTYKTYLEIPGGQHLQLLIASPHDELLADIIRTRRQNLFLFGGLLVLSVIASIYFSRLASRPLHLLSEEARKISRFDFQQPLVIDTRIREIAELAASMKGMKSTIRSFLEIAGSLASESNYDRLLARVTQELSKITEAHSGILYLYQPQSGTLDAVQSYPDHSLPSHPEPLSLKDMAHPVVAACHSRVNISSLQNGELQRCFPDLTHTEGIQTLIAIPLRDRSQNLIGAIALLIDDEKIDSGRTAMAEAVSGAAAISIENQRLIQEQKALLEAFIQLIAGAIDAKSPYTGGHCQRIPTLTKLLAQAASEQNSGPFASFTLNDDEWEQLHIAAWLHDCGKVTTPEYIVDKATKLETLYDRLHEIRMRFEVMKRDAEIACWRAIAEGGDAAVQKQQLAQALAELDADFAFVAECNEGGEFMAPEKITRLQQIARRTWQRTLSDRIGISNDERQRKEREPEQALPVTEYALADKQEHLFPRAEREFFSKDNIWGFRMQAPHYLYNRGELHNLAVPRGTLTDEERYKINEHIIQTIIMLEKLPFPRHLSHVPEIAGGHHEKMDGNGYPRKLTGEQMSTPARMMAIADIFEALTAADRPYKKGKKLSEAIRIMSFMKKDKHIDADLFDLFLTSGVYLKYAREFMHPDQIDDVDIQAYL